MEATAKMCERIIQDGLMRSNLLISIVKKAENLLTENNKPLPAWVSYTSRADDLSLSLLYWCRYVHQYMWKHIQVQTHMC